MSNVVVKENETLDSALRRFKRNCQKAGIQQEIRKREHYEKPSVKRKKKSEAARKRKFKQQVNKKVRKAPSFFDIRFFKNHTIVKSAGEALLFYEKAYLERY